MNITYFQVTGTPLRLCDHCYDSRLCNWCKLRFRAIRDNSGNLRSKKSFM